MVTMNMGIDGWLVSRAIRECTYTHVVILSVYSSGVRGMYS